MRICDWSSDVCSSDLADQAAGDDWAAYGGSQKATRFSPLAQISRNNVAQLQEVWRYHTGDLPKKRWGAETTPLKIGDSVYLCTPHNILISLDARTGKQRWRYAPKVADSGLPDQARSEERRVGEGCVST